jgi:hypothetical protein
MAVATIASLNPSGLEIGAGAAFPLTLLRTEAPSRRWWVGSAATGALLVLSRPTGPLWLALDAMAVALLRGRVAISSAVRTAPGFAAGAASAIALAVGGNLAWEARHGPAVEPSLSAQSLGAAVRLMPTLAHKVVGAFGYLVTWVPEPLVLALGGFAIGLLGSAFGRGGWRERAALALAVLSALAVPLALQAIERHPTGFDLQGRHVLPMFALPLVLASWVPRRAGRTLSSALASCAGPFVALAQVITWWHWSRRHAVGNGGPLWFTGAAEWSPPGGWWLPIALALCGGALLAVASISSGSTWKRSARHLPGASPGAARIV